jgi:hypothetical protein
LQQEVHLAGDLSHWFFHLCQVLVPSTGKWKILYITSETYFCFWISVLMIQSHESWEINAATPSPKRQYWQMSLKIILIFSCGDLLKLEK